MAKSEYAAFISYAHADHRWARRLHRAVERYRLPRDLISGTEHRKGKFPLRPVFRDRDELGAGPSLSAGIQQALDRSRALVVVASPHAVASQWVNEEILYFRTRHPRRPVLAFVVSGEPAADPRAEPETAAFPEALLLQDPDQREGPLTEPLAADARSDGDGFGDAVVRLIAGLLGVSFDRLRQRELRRRQKLWATAGCTALILASTFAVLAWRATIARNEAREARAQAELELISERQTREFLLSVFQLADPSVARGESVTVREVLDRAVARIDETKFDRPVIRARFEATMGQAYARLGINHRAVELLQRSIATLETQPDSDPESVTQSIDSRIELGDVQFDRGAYEEAQKALAQLDVTDATPVQRARVANIHGDILSYLERDEEAMAQYLQALGLLGHATSPAADVVAVQARALGGIGLLHYFTGEFAAAQSRYQAALDLLQPVFGERHPDTVWAQVSLASAAYANGQTQLAEVTWSAALETARALFGDDNPEVGTIKNNLGRLQLELGAHAEAEALLRDAIEIDRRHRTDTFDDLVYPLNSLALARFAQGDSAEAETLWNEARAIAESAGHRMLGPVLTGLADLACASGRTETGVPVAEQALVISVQEFGEPDWRADRAQLTLAYCRALAGEPLDDATFRRAYCQILLRWAHSGHFANRATEQMNAISAGGAQDCLVSE